MTKEMTREMLNIRNRLALLSLQIKIAWLRFKTRKVQLLKSEFVIYTLFILFVGLGFGMAWRANQVEPNLKAQIATFENSRAKLVVAGY